MANPRIDELRKRLEKEPGSRLFAQLAEELRKDGQLPEAIAVSRAGLARHPTYASARMTLGRALFDSGELAAARAEFEAVLKAAPDNILASRLLAESLEGGGDLGAAAAQYEATLKLSPGDRSLVARLEDLRRRPGTEAGPSLAPPSPPPPPGPEAGGEPPPIPLVDADETFEIERPSEAPMAFRRQEAGPAASVYGQETEYGDQPGFEVVHSSSETVRLPAPEKPKAGLPAETAPEPPALPPPAAPVPPPAFAQNAYYRASTSASATWDDAVLIPEPADDELEAPASVAPPESERERPPAMEASVAPLPEAPAAAIAARVRVPPPVAVVLPPPTPPYAAPPPAAEILSPTLAELYYSQGLIDKAIDVYRKMIAAGQGGPKVHSRLAELETAKPHAAAVSGAERRAAIEQTIVRLERFLAAVRRG